MIQAEPEKVELTRGYFMPLFALMDDAWVREKPILAHYTSVEVAERIIATETLWFSNPLYMNDYEELRWGISEVARVVRDDPCG